MSGRTLSLHSAQKYISQLEAEKSKAMSKGRNRGLIKGTFLIGIGIAIGITISFDIHHRLRYSGPLFGYMCRVHGLDSVVTQTGEFGEYGKVHCVDMAGAVDERVLWKQTMERVRLHQKSH